MKKMSLIILLLMLVFLPGCFSGTQESPENNRESSEDMVIEEEVTAVGEEETGSFSKDNQETTTIVLYFADGEGNLNPEERTVSKVTGIARKTMEELCEGPQKENIVETIPPGTRLLDINIKDGLCTVDFSGELIEGHPGGSGQEYLSVYSIVNTLTQFSTVEEVRILVQGQERNTLSGHVDISEPLERNSEILAN